MKHCHSSEKKYSGKKATHFWIGEAIDVDFELKDEWLDRLNSIDGIQISATCSGDPYEKRYSSKYPNFEFSLYPPLTQKDTLISDAFLIASPVAEKSDSVVVIYTQSQKSDELELEFQIHKNVVTIFDRDGTEVERFNINDGRLLKLSKDLDAKHSSQSRGRDPYYWNRPDIEVASRLAHSERNHSKLERWWSDAIDALEYSVEHLY